MKKLIMAILLSGVSASVFGQTDTSKIKGDIQAGWGDLNFAVPESPAFKILGTSPSNIMRPTSVRDISVSVGNYFAGNGATIPQNLAVEISPTIFNPKVNLNNFNANRIWYTSALSVGTKVNADKSYAIGLGLKFRLMDFSDLRTDKVTLTKLDKYGIKDNASVAVAIVAVTNSHLKADPSESYHDWLIKVGHAYYKPVSKADSLIQQQVSTEVGKTFDPNTITTFLDSVKKANWNKRIWDLGVAVLFNSKDSLLRDIQPASKLGVWTTAGLPVFGTKGQILFGATGEVRDSLTVKLNIFMLNLGSRLYYGSNDLKGFVEGDYLVQTAQQETAKASVGIETTFVGGMWLDFSLGLSKQGGAKAVFTPGFNILFGNSEKKTSGS